MIQEDRLIEFGLDMLKALKHVRLISSEMVLSRRELTFRGRIYDAVSEVIENVEGGDSE